jgi:hypothetical protein
MKLKNNILNLGMFLSTLYLVFRFVIWVLHSQPSQGTTALSTLNKLTAIALILLVISFITSKLFIKQPDKNSKLARKMSLAIIIPLAIFTLLFVVIIFWKIQTKTLFDGWQY